MVQDPEFRDVCIVKKEQKEVWGCCRRGSGEMMRGSFPRAGFLEEVARCLEGWGIDDIGLLRYVHMRCVLGGIVWWRGLYREVCGREGVWRINIVTSLRYYLM